jgi:PAS domain S-box-containing protein
MIPPELHRLIVVQAPDAILYADAAGTIRLWNRGAERIFGCPAEQAIGQSLDLIIPDRLRPRHWQGWQQVMATGESRYGEALLRVPALREGGAQFSSEFSIVMIKDAAGQVQGVAAILRDVTAQWEREQALNRKIRDLTEAVKPA